MFKSMIVLLLGIAMAGCVGERTQDPGTARADIAAPAGLLGHRIGTYLQIEGVRSEQGKSGERTLVVDRIGDQPLAPPTSIWIDNLDLPAGTRCVLRGYETGRWIGVPPEVELSGDMPPQQAMWQFQRYFIATSVQSPQSLVEHFRDPTRGR